MKITNIKTQVKNPDRVSIFVDGKYSFSLTLDQLLEQKIKKDLILSDSELKRLKKLSDEGKLKARALEWLMGRKHSEREFRDYMFRKKAEKDLINQWTDEFKHKGYLNDREFALWFAEMRLRKSKSKREIESELYSKGINSETINSVVTELGLANREKDSLKELIAKLRKRPRYSDDEKLVKYLLSKGFNYSDIKRAI